MIYSDEYLAHLFGYHPTDAIQVVKYNNMRNSALDFARVIIANTPICREQERAIEMLQLSLMLASKAVALNNENNIPLPNNIDSTINHLEASSK